jgi:hypothetical protein
MSSFAATFTVDQTPDAVFAAIVDVRSWWTGDIDGAAEQLGDEFTYRYEDEHRSTQQVMELVPGRRVAWRVVDGYCASGSRLSERLDRHLARVLVFAMVSDSTTWGREWPRACSIS